MWGGGEGWGGGGGGGGQRAVWTRIAKDRESWMTLAEGYFLQRKDTASRRIEYVVYHLDGLVVKASGSSVYDPGC